KQEARRTRTIPEQRFEETEKMTHNAKRLPWYRCAALAMACLMAVPAAAQSAAPSAGKIRAATSKVDGQFIRANAEKTPDWPSYGLDYAETRFSRLDAINSNNVKDLGLVWSYNL